MNPAFRSLNSSLWCDCWIHRHPSVWWWESRIKQTAATQSSSKRFKYVFLYYCYIKSDFISNVWRTFCVNLDNLLCFCSGCSFHLFSFWVWGRSVIRLWGHLKLRFHYRDFTSAASINSGVVGGFKVVLRLANKTEKKNSGWFYSFRRRHDCNVQCFSPPGSREESLTEQLKFSHMCRNYS